MTHIHHHSKQDTVHIVGIPTEAGTHWAGQTKAPRAILEQGRLQERLEQIGYQVSVESNILDTPTLAAAAAWKPAPLKNGVRNEKDTLTVLDAVEAYFVKEAKERQLRLQHTFPLILGGECANVTAILAGLHRWHPKGTRIGLIYYDGDVDLSLPSQTAQEGATGILDSMTLSHLTRREGGLDSMRRFGTPDRSPLITRDNVVLFGFDPLQPSTEHWVYLLETGFKAFTRPSVQTDPKRCAEETLKWLAERVDVVYLHVDVDVIDSATYPLGNFPHYAGLQPAQAFEALNVFLCSSLVRGMTLTEVNPNNDADGSMVRNLVDNFVRGLSGR